MGKTVGWILSGLLASLLFMSAGFKLVDWPKKAEEFEKIGFTIELMSKIGVLEIIITILFLIPRTSFVGAILLTGYLGGATVTHLRIGEPFIPPVVIGILLWTALGLRNSAIFPLAIGKSNPTPK